MRPLKVHEDIIPVSDFKARAADHLKRIAESGQPVVITQNGKAAGVLLSPRAYDELGERCRFIEAVRAGLADADARRTVSHAAVRQTIEKRFKH